MLDDELRNLVEEAIEDAITVWVPLSQLERAAAAAIAAATPHIRARVIEELMADLDSEFGPCVHLASDFDESGDLIRRTSFTDWLRARKDGER